VKDAEKQLFELLEKEDLLKIVKKNYSHLEKIFANCLDVKKDEDVLLVGDLGYPHKRAPPVMLGCYVLAARELGIKTKLVIQDPKYMKDVADDSLIEAMLQLNEKGVIVTAHSGKLGSFKTIGSSFRRFIRRHRHRFISTPSLRDLKTEQFPYLVKAINVDYAGLREIGKKVRAVLDKGNDVHVTTRKGTDFHYVIKGMKALSNDGFYAKPGTGGNLPVGEVYAPCADKGCWGRIVIDGSIRTDLGSILLTRPVTLTVENGEAIEIKGGENAQKLEKALRRIQEKAKYPKGVRRIGELGIGINPRAKLVGPTIINEKALGTAHVALGSNSWFGGTVYAISHLDHVFTEPVIKVDGEVLNGELRK